MSAISLAHKTALDIVAISQTCQNYFDGNWKYNRELIGEAFHPVSELYGTPGFVDGETPNVPLLDFMDWLMATKKETTGKRYDSIESIDFGSSTMCLVTVRLQHEPDYWWDILALLKTKDGWKIASKQYHGESTFIPASLHDPASEDMRDITAVLSLYFNGIHKNDVASLEKIFHPFAYLRTLTENGDVANTPIAQFFKDMPREKSELTTTATLTPAHADKVLFVRQIGAESAVAKVKHQALPKYCMDYLFFLKCKGEWKISSKVYEMEMRQ